MTTNKKLTCLIIEDEPIAAEVLSDYINQISFLELKGICKDAVYALDRLQEEQVDVIFLDIHLPKLKGLEFLKMLEERPQTILTTAYHQYALDAFEEDVVDYLLKPIEFSRFLKAVNKLKTKQRLKALKRTNNSESSKAYQFFNVNKKMVKVFNNDILYIESLKDYSRIYTKESSLITRKQIGEMEEIFKEKNFLRIHRSYIVSLERVRAYSSTEVEVEGRSLPIGRSYKEAVANGLKSFFQSE